MTQFRNSVHQFIHTTALLSVCFLAAREVFLIVMQPHRNSENSRVQEMIRTLNGNATSFDIKARQVHIPVMESQIKPTLSHMDSMIQIPEQMNGSTVLQSVPPISKGRPRVPPDDFVLDANTTSFRTRAATTTIVQGIVRQKLLIPGDKHPSFISFLAVRIVGSWEAISVLAAIGTHTPDNMGGCLKWPNEAQTMAELRWNCDGGMQRQIDINGTMHGWSRKLIYPAKRGAKPVHQLCYGFIDFGIPSEVEAVTLPSALWQRRVAMRVRHDFSGRAGNYKATNFLLEARSAIPRPRISLCLDALFGDVRRAALEFLAFQYAIGVKVTVVRYLFRLSRMSIILGNLSVSYYQCISPSLSFTESFCL